MKMPNARSEIKTSKVYEDIDTEIQRRKDTIKQDNSAPKLKPCTKCGGRAEVRHIRIRDFWLLVKFHFHSHQYYCICDNCGAKTRSYHKEELSIEDWNNRRKIKPCPFCCGTAELRLSRRKGLFAKLKRFSHYQYVKCTECGARTEDYITVESAIDNWNMRLHKERSGAEE